MRLVVAAFCVVAIARPADALLVTAALVGFNAILAYLAGLPGLRATEILIVASLLGCGIRAVPNASAFRHALRQSTTTAVVLLCVAAIASMLVWMRVEQVATGSVSGYALQVGRFVMRGYFTDPTFPVVISAAALIEGLALYTVVAAFCRIESRFFGQALRMLAFGGAALAFMSVVRLAEIIVRNPGIVETLRSTYAGLRISPQIPDYIAAGAYFALCWLAALGIALASRRRIGWLLAGVPLLAGLYLAGSRSPIFAAAAGVGLMIVAVIRRRDTSLRAVAVFAIVAVIAMAGTFRFIIGHDIAGETAWQSVIVRYELVRTGLKVMATRPVFGVGLDRFFVPAEELATPRLRAMWQARKNPHNDFLRVGAELGAIGLVLFLWILGSSSGRIWRALRTTGDARLAGLAGGLTAFLITSLTSNPLMVRDVSFAFWIALGLADGRSAVLETAQKKEDRLPQWTRWSRLRVAAAGLAAFGLLVSVPFRAAREVVSVDPTRVSYGLSEWATEADGTRYRTSGPRATVYVDGRARLLEIPLRGTLPSGALQRVDVLIDGRPINAFSVGGDWQRFRALVPDSSSNESRRVDFVVSPWWVPSDVIPGSDDRRALGVKIGEIKTRRF